MIKVAEFNPLDYINLTRLCASELKSRALTILPIPKADIFNGAGVYALYYVGAKGIYKDISGTKRPIYVGKAEPSGGRKGLTQSGHTRALYWRLSKHVKSITTTKLKISDFRCRFIVLQPIWIKMAERLLIEEFKPPWNLLIDGFGNNPQGKNRAQQIRSRWDTLHPGRPAADALTANPKNAAELKRLLSDFLAKPPTAAAVAKQLDAGGDDDEE